MATSGTISRTVFNTRKVVDSAYRYCRVPPQTITGEMIETAKDQLFLMLSEWQNIGVPLWCQSQYIVGFNQGLFTVPLPVGIIDVMDINIRDVTRQTDGLQSSTSGNATSAFDDDFTTVDVLAGIVDQSITIQFNDTMAITTVGILPGSTKTASFELQQSIDGATWTTLYTGVDQEFVDSKWVWVDIQAAATVAYYRLVVDVLGLPFSVRELAWCKDINEINMARINRDDWFYTPDKSTQGRPVQFWLDRQREQANLNIWPAPDYASRYRSMSMIAQRYIMDVGTLQQEVEVPQRWYSALTWGLAAKLAIMTPEVKMEMIPVTKGEAGTLLAQAWAEERDRSPVNIEIDISPYTR